MRLLATQLQNQYESNPNPYVSTEGDWKKYAANNGAALIGMDVHYIDCREGTAKCTAATIVKVNSGWETYAQTINANVKIKFANGTKDTRALDLSGKNGPVCPNWHFISHDPKLVPHPSSVPVYPPGTILEDNRGTYNPLAPPTPDYTGSYVLQDPAVNNNQCTYFAWIDGVLQANILLDSCNQDTVPLNQQYLGQDSGNVTDVSKLPSSEKNLLGVEQGTGSYTDTYYSMGGQWFLSNSTASCRGVRGTFQIGYPRVAIGGQNCSGMLSTTTMSYFPQVRVTINSGTYLSLGIVAQCNNIAYYAATKTVGGATSLVGSYPYIDGGHPTNHVFKIEQEQADYITPMFNLFLASTTHEQNMVGNWKMTGVGAYKGSDGITWWCQLFDDTDTGNPYINIVNSPIFEWGRNSFSSAVESRMVIRVNNYRIQKGKPVLKLSPVLISKARERAKWMSDHGVLSHRIPDHGPDYPPNYGTALAYWSHAQDPKGTHDVFDEIYVDTQLSSPHKYNLNWNILGENIGTYNYGTDVPNNWRFTIDDALLGTTRFVDQRGGIAALAGLESHIYALGSVPAMTFGDLKYKFSDDTWKEFSNPPIKVISAPDPPGAISGVGILQGKPVMCGRWIIDTAWSAAQNTTC